MDESKLRVELEETINRSCGENGSNTPDFILAEYLIGCLHTFDVATNAREKWYGRKNEGPGRVEVSAPPPSPVPSVEPSPLPPNASEAAVSLLYDLRGRVLCVWNDRFNRWTLPGGKVEPGESLPKAQKRELEEETSLKTLVASLVYFAYHKEIRVSIFLTHAFGTPKENERGRCCCWMLPEELISAKDDSFAEFYREMFSTLGSVESL